jgi:hypothetical protein
MSQSNVGNSQIYEAGDQRNYKDSELREAKEEARFHEGKENSHKALDSSTSPQLTCLPPQPHPLTSLTEDERSIANKLEREEKREKEGEDKSLEDRQREQDATLPARAHGNEPSKGAKIDQQLPEEEDAELKAKGKA